MTRTITAISAGMLVLAALASGGCKPPPAGALGELQQCRRDADALRKQANDLQQQLRDSQAQVETLQGLGDKRLDLIYHVASIKLGRYTGGYDADGKPGDDGVRVFLEPLDADLHPLKAAGAATVQVFDLAAAPEKHLLHQCSFDVDQLRGHWYGAFLSYHYRLDCPWPSGPPDHREITIRVTFTDYLTGKTFTAQKAVQVNLPPTTQP